MDLLPQKDEKKKPNIYYLAVDEFAVLTTSALSLLSAFTLRDVLKETIEELFKNVKGKWRKNILYVTAAFIIVIPSVLALQELRRSAHIKIQDDRDEMK